MSALRPPLEGPRAPLRWDVPTALVLAAAAALTWFNRASWWALGAGALGAFVASIIGSRLGGSALRTWVALCGAAAGTALGLGALHVAGLAPVPGSSPWPEVAATVRDACTLAVVSAGLAAPLAFLAARTRFLRVLPLAALALAAGAMLAAHRGGSINRPYEIADLAWIRGWHPALLLTVAGIAAALTATFALFRPRGSGPAWAAGAAAVLLALLVLVVTPSIGLIQFPMKDPLGLSGKPTKDERDSVGGRGGKGSHQGGARGGHDPLGLQNDGGKGGEPPPDMVPFQDDYSSSANQVPVAVVVLRDDVQPANGMLYFRQLAFSSWNGRRLVRSFDAGVDADLFDGFPAAEIERPAPAPADLFQVVPATVSLLRDHVQPPVLSNGIALAPEENADPALFRRTYQTRSAVFVAPHELLLGRKAGSSAWSDDVRRAYLEVPPDPRYRELADRIVAGLKPQYRDDPWARVLATALWLQENTKYSLRSHHAGAADPTADFLFGDRIGYCVHLAHAGAFLMRAAGVPARVAAGYAYEAKDRLEGSALLLRSGDAHAWAEAYLDGVGWVPIDPAPPSLDPPAPAPDIDLQRLLGEMARPKHQRLAQDTGSAFRWPSLQELLLGVAVLGCAWVGTGHATKAWRRAAPAFARRDRAGRTAYRASLDRLAEAGLARAPGETREKFARRAGAVAPAFAELTALHLAARFGRRPADPARARALGGTVARQLRARASRRRWLGLLAPWRWTRSR